MRQEVIKCKFCAYQASVYLHEAVATLFQLLAQ